jgi:hypothetical protein
VNAFTDDARSHQHNARVFLPDLAPLLGATFFGAPRPRVPRYVRSWPVANSETTANVNAFTDARAFVRVARVLMALSGVSTPEDAPEGDVERGVVCEFGPGVMKVHRVI